LITLINGNAQSAAGVSLANGSIVLQLNQDATLLAGPGYVAGSVPVTFRFDSSGNLLGTCRVWSNAELSGNTWYNVTFYDQNNARLSTATWQFTQASGATVDIGTMVTTTPGAPAVSFPFGQQSQTSAASMSFSAASYNQFKTSMTTNVSSSSIVGGVAGAYYTFIFTQDGTGGHTFSWPVNVIDAQAIDTTANSTCQQTFCFDGTNFRPIGAQVE
jgi:hypothetical protein